MEYTGNALETFNSNANQPDILLEENQTWNCGETWKLWVEEDWNMPKAKSMESAENYVKLAKGDIKIECGAFMTIFALAKFIKAKHFQKEHIKEIDKIVIMDVFQ